MYRWCDRNMHVTCMSRVSHVCVYAGENGGRVRRSMVGGRKDRRMDEGRKEERGGR